MLIIAVYNIGDEARRRKVTKILKKYGERVGMATFELIVGENKIPDLCNELGEHLKEGGTVRLYRVCKKCIKNSLVFGDKAEKRKIYFSSSESQK